MVSEVNRKSEKNMFDAKKYLYGGTQYTTYSADNH